MSTLPGCAMDSSKRTLRCGEGIGGVWFFVHVFLNSVDTINHEFSHNSLTMTPSHYFKKGYDFICQVLIFLKSLFSMWYPRMLEPAEPRCPSVPPTCLLSSYWKI